MGRLYMGTASWGVLLDSDGNARAGVSVQIKNRDATNATHWSARTGGSSSTAQIVTDSDGTLTRYIEPGAYTLTSGSTTVDIEAVMMRQFPVSIDLYGPQSQEAFSLVSATAATYAFPGSALSASSFEMYAGMNARVAYAVWHVVWTPTNVGAGIELVKFDAGPTNIEQIAEITNQSGGPLNSSALVTSAVQTIIDGIADLTVGVGPHKQIGHRVKGNGSVACKVYMSRVSVLFEA